MLYGLNNYILSPPFSLIIGVLLFIGVSFLGSLLLNNFKELKEIFNGKYFFLHSSLVGINFILLILYTLTTLRILNIIIFQIIAIILICLGIWTLFKKKNYITIKEIFNDITFDKDYTNLILIAVIVLSFFLSLYPLSHADALNYHSHAAINYLQNGKFPSEIFSETLNDAGIGELLISLGLSIGSHHFSNIIQFAGILSLFAVFFEKNKLYNKILLLSVITSPVIIFFLTSSKPQFLLIINSLIIFKSLLELKNEESVRKILILFTILSINFLSKFSFIVSGSILTLLIFYSFFRRVLFWKIFVSSSIVFLTLILPYMIYRYLSFDTNLFLQFTSHLPINLEYYEVMNEYIKFQSDGNRLAPIFLLIPLSPSNFTLTIGVGLLILLLLNIKKNKLFILSSFLILFFYLFYGPNVARFIFEPFIFLIYLIFLNHNNFKSLKRIFSFTTIVQAGFAIIVMLFSISLSLPSSINEKSMSKFMKNYAYEYQLAQWVNQNFNNKLNLISNARSIGLLNNNSYHFSFNFEFVNQKNTIENDLLKEFFKEKKLNHILIIDEKNKFKHSDCLGDLVLKSEDSFNHVSRNPFRKKKDKYFGYIYQFKLNNFPNCLKK